MQRDHQSTSDSSGQRSSTLPDKSPTGQVTPQLSNSLSSTPPSHSSSYQKEHLAHRQSGRSQPPYSSNQDRPLSSRSETPLSGRLEDPLSICLEPPLSSRSQPPSSNLGLQDGHSGFNQGLQEPSSASDQGMQEPPSGCYQGLLEPPDHSSSNQGFLEPPNSGHSQPPGSNQGFQEPFHSHHLQTPGSFQQPRRSHSNQAFEKPLHSGRLQPPNSNQRFQEPPRSLPPSSDQRFQEQTLLHSSRSQSFQEQMLPSGKVVLTEQEDTFSPNSQEQQKTRFSQWGHSSQSSLSSSSALKSLESLSEEFDFWTDEDSDYLTSHSLVDSDNHSHWYNARARDTSYSGSEPLLSPPSSNSRSFSSSSRESSRAVTPESSKRLPVKIPPPPFTTPPKLRSVEQVMNNYSGTDLAALRRLTTALAREAIFGRDELAKKSLTGRNNTEQLDEQKVNYIKTLVHSRVPNKSAVDFEETWKFCRGSLSKSCQTLRNSKRKCFSDY